MSRCRLRPEQVVASCIKLDQPREHNIGQQLGAATIHHLALCSQASMRMISRVLLSTSVVILLQGSVREVLWFFDPAVSDPFAIDGRCLVRYTDGRVKQSVLPPSDARLGYAMGAHGVKVRSNQHPPMFN